MSTGHAFSKTPGSMPVAEACSAPTCQPTNRYRATVWTPGTCATWSVTLGENGAPTAFETT